MVLYTCPMDNNMPLTILKRSITCLIVVSMPLTFSHYVTPLACVLHSCPLGVEDFGILEILLLERVLWMPRYKWISGLTWGNESKPWFWIFEKSKVWSLGELMANLPMVEDKGDYFVAFLYKWSYPWWGPNFDEFVETMGHAKETGMLGYMAEKYTPRRPICRFTICAYRHHTFCPQSV